MDAAATSLNPGVDHRDRVSESSLAPPGPVDDPHRWVQDYTRARRENFAVLSWVLPRRMRPGFAALYAWCRFADDLADEAPDPDTALRDLQTWRGELQATYAGRPTHPITRALCPFIEQHALPQRLLDDLLDAFVQDQTVTRYGTWNELLDYCRRSANPVGRLVLMLGAHADTPENAERFRLADATCTALQVINHVQDVRRDVLDHNRVYLPAEIATKHDLSVDQIAACIRDDHTARRTAVKCAGCPDGSIGLRALQPAYRASLREMTDRAAELFAEGRGLWPLLPRDLRRPVQLFTLGGEAVVRRVRQMQFDTPVRRPTVPKTARLALLARVAIGMPGSPPSSSSDRANGKV